MSPSSSFIFTLLRRLTYPTSFFHLFFLAFFLPPNSFSKSPSHRGKRQQQELITELRRRQGKDSRHVYEGKDGAIEDIITGE